MKNILLTLLSLLALTLTGCEPKEQTQQQIDAEVATEITTFSYKGHTYLKYHHYAGNATVAGITHDPD